MRKTCKRFGQDSPVENKTKGGSTYAETSGGFFTSLRKRLAFTIASSRLVAAASPLNFFDRPPSRLGPARRLFTPP